jgi:protein SCO1
MPTSSLGQEGGPGAVHPRPWRHTLLLAAVIAVCATGAFAVVRELILKPRDAARAAEAAKLVKVVPTQEGFALASASPPGARVAHPPPPVLFALPDFKLIDQDGRPFGLAELRGKVWVASFFFTSCPSICPKLIAKLRLVQEATKAHGPAVRIVSLSVDPKTDTPPKLLAYARKHGADPARWSFLTGPLPDIEKAIREGFKQALERQTEPVKGPLGEDLYDITHGARFVLVDREGRLRGFYDADGPGRAALVRDVDTLVAAGPAR